MTPKPPPFDIAATRLRSETQVIAPPMIASSVPRNSEPRRQSRSSRRRARSRASLPPGPPCPSASGLVPASRSAVFVIPSISVEAVGRVQGADRQLGVVLCDQHAHLDLGCGDHLDVDAFVSER